MKLEKVVSIQVNRSFDLSGPIKLAKFKVFVYSKMEHKISKIRRNLYASEKPRIRQLKRYIYFHNTMITSEIISHVFFTHFELGYLTSYLDIKNLANLITKQLSFLLGEGGGT